MPVTFDGITITAGIPPLFGLTSDSTRGTLGGRPCRIKKVGGVGISIDPFRFVIPCDCQPQQGDTIEVTVITILFVDVTQISWNLCGGRCRDSMTQVGISLGLEIKQVAWEVG